MRTTSWLTGICERLTQAKARSRASLRNMRYPAQAEMLEVRQLLAAVITLNAGGWVKIDGTEQDDVATVEAVDADNIRIRVVTGAETVEQTFAKTALMNHIDFAALGGHDSLTNTTDRRTIMTGDDGNDTLLGSSGADTFVGGNGDDSFNGGVGNDQALGGEGNDSLTGGGGNDSLKGENGNDTINADTGNDTVSGGDGTDSLNGGTGTDLISEAFSTATNYVLAQNSASSTDAVKNFETASLVGSAGNDVMDLSGFTFPATMSGGLGNDSLTGGSNADLIYGDSGNDTLVGGLGNDILQGGANDDWLTGGAGDDVLNAGSGSRDILSEVADANLVLSDTALSGAGADRLIGIEYAKLVGGAGNNTLDASAFTLGFVTLEGGAGNDSLIGTAKSDIFTGGLGSDTITAGDGYDMLREMGDDLVLSPTELRESGVINEHSSIEAFRLDGTAAKSHLDASAMVIAVSAYVIDVDLYGNDGDDTLLGCSAGRVDVMFYGGRGTDRSVSNITGTKYLSSGCINNGNPNDGGQPRTYINDIEIVEMVGDDSPNRIDTSGWGTQAVLRGMGGNDTLIGGGGLDTLEGGAGDDSLVGGGGSDRVVASADADFTATPTQLTGEGTDTLSGIEQVDITGGASNNRLDATGFTNGPALLNGGIGNDTLLGTNHNDTLNGGEGLDSLVGGSGTDLLRAENLANSVYAYRLTDSNLQQRIGSTTHLFDQFQSIEKAYLAFGSGTGGGELDASPFTLGPVTLMGGPGSDSLTGTSRGDSLDGGGGTDWVRSGGNFNFVVTDTSMTGRGNDVLANIEALQLLGGSAANLFDARGFHGTTFLHGYGGNDTILGASGRDLLYGGDGDDSLVGGEGNDLFENGYGTGSGNDTMIGGEGNDSFLDGPGVDVYEGGGGDDVLQLEYSSNESDSFDGGSGYDTWLNAHANIGPVTVTDFQVTAEGRSTSLVSVELVKVTKLAGLFDASAATISVFASGTTGNDTILGGAGDDTLNGIGGDDSLIGNGGHDSLNGGDGNDTLNAGSGNNKLIGGNGDDSLIAGDGNDRLDGGLGIDTVDSGLGTDTLLGHEVGS